MAVFDQASAARRTSAHLVYLAIAGLLVARAGVAMPSDSDPQDVCRIVALSPAEYRALADEIRALPPIDPGEARNSVDPRDRVVVVLRERLGQVLTGRGSTDEQIAAILALMRSIDADLGVMPERYQGRVAPWMTLSLLASECGETERAPAPFETADQDVCRIGAIGPEGYRAIAAEVAALPAIDWRVVVQDDAGRLREDLEDRVAAVIRDRVQEAVAPRESSDEQVAAMHAVLRSISAEFAWVNLGHSYEDPDYRRVPAAFYHYRIDVNRLGVVRRVFRWGRIDVSLYTDQDWTTIQDLRSVIFHFPVPISPSISGLEKGIPVTGPCPPALADAERPRARSAEE